MENSILFMILLQVFLILLNAVFASAEIAVISINDAKLARMAAEGDKRAVRLARLTSQPARFLATIQVAITLSGFLGSAFAAENFSDGLVNWLVSLGVGVPAATLDAIAVVIITLVLSYFTLIFGELVPKRVAMRKAESLALGISGLISAIAKLFAPIVWFLTASTNAVLRLLGIDPNAEEETVSEEEIRMMVDVGTQKGTIDHEEKQFIQNVFEFDDLTAGEIATHTCESIHRYYGFGEQLPTAITQVAYNLIDNAVKFCPPGGQLGLSLRESGSKVYVSISNTGDTIPPEELPLVFDRFHKIDKSRSLNRDGWGLGLYIVKTIICSHGEDISVTSRDGKTEFTFTLAGVNSL